MDNSIFPDKKSIYDDLREMIELDIKQRDYVEDENDGLEEKEYRKAVAKEWLKGKYKVIIIYLFLCGCIVHSIVAVGCLVASIISLSNFYLFTNPLHLIFWAVSPFVLWVLSTLYDDGNFHNRKCLFMAYCLGNIGIILAHFLTNLSMMLFIPLFYQMPITPDISQQMINHLAMIIFFVIALVPAICYIRAILKAMSNKLTQDKILKFKLGKKVDFRKNTEFAYDMKLVKDLKTAVTKIIKEKDRFLHAIANGTTGTGKTSSLFIVQIANDLKQRCYNLAFQKKTINKWLISGKVRMKNQMDDKDFSLDNFEPVSKEDKDIIKNLKFKAKLAGITAMAPNASFADEIYSIAKAMGINKVNRVDPTLDEEGYLKEGFIGFNPLYISPEIKGLQRRLEISRKAVLFADVAQAIYDAGGSSDVYFASLNKNITTTVTMLVVLTYPYLHIKKPKKYTREQPCPAQVQEIINDFERAKEYRDALVELFGEKNELGHIIKEPGKAKVGPYQFVLDTIDNGLLGQMKEKLFDQAQGLRNIINGFLTNPLIANALCCEKSIDMDSMFANGELTVVNYALELGENDSKAFGLFFMLSMINATYRRPGNEDTRIPHFFYVDELPVLMHPRIESCFSLFRQYRVAMFVAIQSLSQTEKENKTKFLKEVLLGNCAHHFVYGRVAPQEMDLYEKLAGTSVKLIEMSGYTQTSLTVENPTISFSEREQLQRENNAAGGDIRSLDFQEVFVVTVVDGSPIDAFFGKTAFLPKYRKIKKKRESYEWKQWCFQEDFLDETIDTPIVVDEMNNSIIDLNDKLIEEEINFDLPRIDIAFDEFIEESRKEIDENIEKEKEKVSSEQIHVEEKNLLQEIESMDITLGD